jgi:hypothetical protein
MLKLIAEDVVEEDVESRGITNEELLQQKEPTAVARGSALLTMVMVPTPPIPACGPPLHKR